MHSSYILDKLNRVALHMGTEVPTREEMIDSLKRIGVVLEEGGVLHFALGKLISNPHLLRPLLEMLFRDFDLTGFNLLMGGDFEGALFASYLSLEKLIPQIALRSDGKIEGDFFAGQRTLVIFPVIDNPIVILKLMERLISEGVTLHALITLIDLEEGILELARNAGVPVYSLFKASEFLEES